MARVSLTVSADGSTEDYIIDNNDDSSKYVVHMLFQVFAAAIAAHKPELNSIKDSFIQAMDHIAKLNSGLRDD